MENHEMNEKNTSEKTKEIVNAVKSKRFLWIIGGAVLIVFVGLFGIMGFFEKGKEEPQVITKSTLEKIINISELSTYESIYNGVAVVKNENNDSKIDFYVSYEAVVKAGIDFEKVEVDVDHEDKIIIVTMPEIQINDVSVDIASLDYIFENDNANTENVSARAYSECIKDVQEESSKESAIVELAEENAKGILEALIMPFVKQLDSDYELEIKVGGDK